MLKADSLATVVIGMLKTSQAILERQGNLAELTFQKSKTSNFVHDIKKITEGTWHDQYDNYKLDWKQH